MSIKMSKKALLIIGGEKISRNRPYVSFLRFIKYARRLEKKSGLELKILSYEQILSAKVPPIAAGIIQVVPFFPYRHWNRHIEVYPDSRIYGDKAFGREFKFYLRKVRQALERCYRGKRIEYVNPLENCYLDRDKIATKDLLRKGAVPTPRTLKADSFNDVRRLLNTNSGLYIKPRFGSMGKGISYIDRENLVSNFLFRKGRIVSRITDFNWPFVRVKNQAGFLNTLLKRGFICEEAINPPLFRGNRFDFRAYVVFGKVVYLYAKSSPAQFQVTNWSQGGRIDKKETILNTLPKEKIAQIGRLARRAARALGLNFVGIDIIYSQDLKSAYVLEGNAFPGYERGFDLQKCLLNYLVK